MTVNRRESDQAKLLRVKQVSQQLSVSVRTVWRLTSAGELPAPVAIGRCKRWRQADVDRFLESLDDGQQN